MPEPSTSTTVPDKPPVQPEQYLTTPMLMTMVAGGLGILVSVIAIIKYLTGPIERRLDIIENKVDDHATKIAAFEQSIEFIKESQRRIEGMMTDLMKELRGRK